VQFVMLFCDPKIAASSFKSVRTKLHRASARTARRSGNELTGRGEGRTTSMSFDTPSDSQSQTVPRRFMSAIE